MSFIFLLLLMFYIGESFDTPEQQLLFQPPVVEQGQNGGAYLKRE